MSYFEAKMHQISISAGAPPQRAQTPVGELTALPQILQLDLRGPTSKGREGSGREKGREGIKGRGGARTPSITNFWLRRWP